MVQDLKGILILLTFSVISAIGFNSLSPYGIGLSGHWDEFENKVQTADALGIPGWVLETVRNKSRVIIDVRDAPIYGEGHIPGAVNYPLSEFDDNMEKMLQQLPQATALLLYCSSIQCTDSHTFARYLEGMGYQDVTVFDGGFRMWEASGYDVEKKE